MEKKIEVKKILKALLYAAILLILFTAVQMILELFSMAFSVGYALYRAFLGDEFYLSRPIMEFAYGKDAITLATLLGTTATGIFFGLWWFFHNRARGTLKSRFNNGVFAVSSKLFMLILVVFFCYGMAEIAVIGMTLAIPDKVEEYSKIAENFTSNKPLIDILTIVVFAPIGEECLFRGLILKKFSECMNIWIAIVLQALLFGIFHGNIVQGLYVLAIGLVNGYLSLRFKSVLPCIFVHAMLNGFSLVLSYIPQSITQSVQFNGVMLLIPFVSFGMLFSLLPRDEYGQIDLKL